MENASGSDLLIGYLSLFVSCSAFGFLFVPLKRCDTKDGLFVQWVQCAVVFMCGVIVNIARGLPPFNLTAAIGGFLYATGNVASVPIVTEMGIGLGMLTWGSVQIIVGWSVAKFGLFGTKPQPIQSPLINYLGVLITLISGVMFVSVYSRQKQQQLHNAGTTTGRHITDEPGGGGGECSGDGNASNCGMTTHCSTATVPLRVSTVPTGNCAAYGSVNSSSSSRATGVECDGCQRVAKQTSNDGGQSTAAEAETVGTGDRSELGTNAKWQRLFSEKSSCRKWVFVALAVCLGCLHGLMLTPIVYVQDTDPNASKNVLDFVFSHFCAVFFFSTLYFVLYALIRRGRPFVHPSLVLPSVAYGLLWSVGMTLFIVSNRILSQPVSFPVTVRLPAIIGAMVDVFLFRDIQGRRHLAWLFGAITVGAVGVILVSISLY